MDATRIQETLAASESALASPGDLDLAATGFWAAVAAVKRDPELREEFGARIARIDDASLQRWALACVPVRVGTGIMAFGTAVGLGVIAVAYAAEDPWNGLLLVGGTGMLLVTTHGLAHLAVGAMSGIRFTHWFIGSVWRPQPGVKVDYESYLAVSASHRARMHASGAIVTKSLPFLLLGTAWGMHAPAWAWWVLIGIGVASVITDVLWSVGASDWKRYRREKRLADAGF